MAIDPRIALGVNPPVIAPLQLRSPIEQLGKMISIRNLMTQGQLGQLNVQQTQLENERLQKSAQEEQNLGSWMQQNQDRQDLTPQEIIAAHPNTTGVKFATAWSAQQKANMEAHSAAITNRLNDQKAIDRELHGITDNPTKNAALATAVKNGWLTSDQAAPYLSMDVADPKWKDFTGRVQAQTMDAVQRAEAAKKLIDLRIAQATEGPVTKKAIAEATKAEQEVAGTQPITAQQKIANELAAANAAETAKQHSVQNEIDRARLGISQQELGLRKRQDTNDDDLASTVIANPSLYDNLTPSARTRIAPLLSKQGFTEFGKPLGEAAMTKLAESRSAIESLKDLRQTLKDNEQYIGPVAGLQSLNPYSEARVAQAKINLVKQRVGKALEGGVLRKEDEEKYKQILATLRDTPSTAIAKVDSLLTSIDRDIKLFEQEQRRGGRNVPAMAGAAAPSGGTVKMKAPNGQVTDVAADQVEHYKSQGAVVVTGK